MRVAGSKVTLNGEEIEVKEATVRALRVLCWLCCVAPPCLCLQVLN
jgi:hypothetical protein